MANIKSAEKRAKKALKQNLRNKAVKSKVKTAIKKFETAVATANPEEAKTTLHTAIKAIDKAGAKGILHKNNVANKKSRLTKMFNGIAG